MRGGGDEPELLQVVGRQVVRVSSGRSERSRCRLLRVLLLEVLGAFDVVHTGAGVGAVGVPDVRQRVRPVLGDVLLLLGVSLRVCLRVLLLSVLLLGVLLVGRVRVNRSGSAQ